MAQEAEDILRLIQGSKGVLGSLIVNNEGIPIKTNLNNALSVQYAGLMQNLVEKTRLIVKELDPSNELSSFRIRTAKHEIIVTPDRDYIFITIQESTD
ncbi:dynein light chain roadblock-type 2-like [Condylostylus longicornis]|uniref:dynein light chain roadblock-type 2-like n=1 Tax=Condylostylus longicornis TaxID=2530218 RepID=UPI00244DF52A|nr:dynein light chain roadblock-type 2-like [Condylostylus longicornis]